MTLYASLDYTKRELKAAQPTSSVMSNDDMRLAGHLREVSMRLDSEFPQIPRWPYFAPWRGTRKFLVTPQQVNSALNTFQFHANLLELTGDVTYGDVTLVDGTNVEVWPDAEQPPFNRLRLIDRWQSWYGGNCNGCGAPVQVSIPGVWGYHRDYANAWQQTTTLTATMTDSQMDISVDNLSASNDYGITPGISIGSLIRIVDGTTEFMEVTAVDFIQNTATVLRGVNGTTKIAHTDAAAGVEVFQVENPVQIAVARQAALMYARQGAFTTVEVVGMTEIRYPADWLVEVRAMMGGYSNGY